MTSVLNDDPPHYLASTLADLAATTCQVDPDDFGGIDTLEAMYTPDFLERASQGLWDELQPWGCFLAENSVGRSSVPRIADTPILAIFSEQDELVEVTVERESVSRLCDGGYRIERIECAGASHTGAAGPTVVYALDWLAARLAGEPWPTDPICRVDPPTDCDSL
jgi:hypothetical protein